ncbi:response regulator [Anatilimnocola sp. NA78]|uniref:response regulator n=1 Tax=Anatilimnocola sp. NA78 TaxID=3415683 RepID=UPI003CE5A5BA
MNIKVNALIVDDDERISDSVADTLASLGHAFDIATNQHDAQGLLERNLYDYVLLDLQIPAKPNRGGAHTEFGSNLLRYIQHLKGNGQLPVIVMTGYSADCLDLSTELLANGAREFIAKPFPNKGRTLACVIRKVLGNPTAPRTESTSTGQFPGAELVFFTDRVEICGAPICTRKPSATRWLILNALRERHLNGTYMSLTGQELAKTAQIKESSVAGAIRGLRTNISQVLSSQNITSDGSDVVHNRGAGYQLGPRVRVIDGESSALGAIMDNVPGPDVHNVHNRPVHDVHNLPVHDVHNLPVHDVHNRLVHDVHDVPIPGVHNRAVHDSTTDVLRDADDDVRIEWILQQIQVGRRLKGPDIVERFGCSSKTAYRLLKSLRERGEIQFVGSPRVGFYEHSEER